MKQKAEMQFLSLELLTKPNVDTAHAAQVLNRQPQTLRGWACHEDGPMRPLRINGRLAWPVAELRRVLQGVSKNETPIAPYSPASLVRLSKPLD